MDPKKDTFVRNEADKQEGGGFSLRNAFSCAFQGLLYAVKSQRNFKIQIGIALGAVALGFVLRIPFSSWLALIICMGMVLAAECVNTAVESAIDLVSPEYALLAKRAKDCAAAGVLVCALAAVAVGLSVYIDAALRLLGSG